VTYIGFSAVGQNYYTIMQWNTIMHFLDQAPMSYHYSSCSCCWLVLLGANTFKKSPRLRRFILDDGSEWNLAGLFFNHIDLRSQMSDKM